MRCVIMAAGRCVRWNNFMGIPKQLAQIDGEPIIKRTIRLLKERGVDDIYVTVRYYGQYGDLDVKEYISSPNEISIDRIYGARTLSPAIYLYGDVYYTEQAIDIILSDTNDCRFFGRLQPGKIKSNREIFAIKSNDFIMQKAAELRRMHMDGVIKNSLGGHLLYHCLGIKPNPRAKEIFCPSVNMITDYFTEINDLTDDFDKPADYIKFLKVTGRVRPPIVSRPVHPIRKPRQIPNQPREVFNMPTPTIVKTRAEMKPVAKLKTKSGYVKTPPIRTYFTIDRLAYDVIHNLLPKIPDVDLVVGIPRDGIIVAYLISIYRNIPFTDLDSYIEGRLYTPGIKHRRSGDLESNVKRILLVDDICASGSAMRDAKKRLPESNVQVYAGVVYASKPEEKLKSGIIDCYGWPLVGPRHYQWTHCDAVHLPGTMMDIDGILCPDWTGGDDTGINYETWLQTVPLKICPKNVGTLITWRREEHREITENWLKEKGITYTNLIMADRDKWRSVGEYKAFYYNKSEARLFVESNPKQAKHIYELTKRPVICFETNEAWGLDED